MHRAYIGIGANQGDVFAAVRIALAEIEAIEGCRITGRSSWYRTAPIDAAGPDFINGVVAVDTVLDPLSLLERLFEIERRFGRKRAESRARNAPRAMDLDLLLMADFIIGSALLVLPHPRMHLRGFVLKPLLELAPGIVIPGLGPASGFVAATADQRVSRW
jgi:2-amino-4-hydroxy-6-hydroxymethyldihydropteridine diphosphokinase